MNSPDGGKHVILTVLTFDGTEKIRAVMFDAHESHGYVYG